MQTSPSTYTGSTGTPQGTGDLDCGGCMQYSFELSILSNLLQVIKALPYLRNFEPPAWPVQEMIKVMLRNKRGCRKCTAPTTTEGLPLDRFGGGSDEADAA